MRTLFLFLTFIISIYSVNAQRQRTYADVAPSGNQNRLPVEGGSIIMQIDSTSSLSNLIDKLNGKWRFIETGKLYWIGYTEDMYSIAARGNSAIQPLLRLAEDSINKSGGWGAVYTLHLIGINREIKGRFFEEFSNHEARKALLYLLKYPELQSEVISLLIRDPWYSDIPSLLQTMRDSKSDCWSIVNSLLRYKINDAPIRQNLPDTAKKIFVKLSYDDPMVSRSGELEKRYLEVIDSIDKLNNSFVILDKSLVGKEIWGNIVFGGVGGAEGTSLENILNDLTEVDYTNIGTQLQYYIDSGKIYICTPETAKKRWIKWWDSLSEEERKKKFADNPVWRNK